MRVNEIVCDSLCVRACVCVCNNRLFPSLLMLPVDAEAERGSEEGQREREGERDL